jgi:hypothetical protein
LGVAHDDAKLFGGMTNHVQCARVVAESLLATAWCAPLASTSCSSPGRLTSWWQTAARRVGSCLRCEGRAGGATSRCNAVIALTGDPTSADQMYE